MLFLSILIAFAACVFTIFYYRQKYNYVIAIYFISLSVMMIIGVLYLSKTTTYKFYSSIDYSIYAFLRNIPLHINAISRIYNISIFCFYLASVVFVTVLYTSKRIAFSLIIIIPAVVFVIINDYTITWNLYLLLHNGNDTTNTTLGIIKFFNIICMLFYIMMPVIYLIAEYFRAKIYIYKRYTLIAMLNIILIDVFFLRIFVYGAFKSIWINNVKITKFPNEIDALGLNIIHPISVLLLLILSISVTVFIKPFRYSVFKQKNNSTLKFDSLQENARYTFHMYKNSIMCIEKYMQLIKLCINQKSIDDIEKYSDDILKIISKTTSSLSRDINSLKKIRLNIKPFSLIECIQKNIQELNITNIVNINACNCNELFLRGDEEYIAECFYNILKNSLDALEHEINKKIEITIFSEKNMVYIEFTDNGCGIKKNELKYIFNDFYTTKSRTKGSGIGLSFSKKVIESHNGYITANSKLGKYTSIKIVLPISENNRKEE